jgi:hypothetical protein
MPMPALLGDSHYLKENRLQRVLLQSLPWGLASNTGNRRLTGYTRWLERDYRIRLSKNGEMYSKNTTSFSLPHPATPTILL